jgi:hypothetical protein
MLNTPSVRGVRQAVVMVLRSGRLEQVFGRRVDELSASELAGLVDNSVPEAFDLDFKEAPYGRSDGDKRSLAVDVAALANTAGGVIIIGVREDAQAQACELTPVEMSDDEVARMRQVVGSLVAPMPTFDVFLVRDDSADSPAGAQADETSSPRGFVVLAVSRSPSGPHAVLVNDALRYPRRNGATTYYLSEPEVAAAYQARATGLAARVARLDDVWKQGLSRLAQDGQTWVAVAMVPDSAGAMRLDRDAYATFQQRWSGRDPHIVRRGAQMSRTSVDQGVLHADGGSGDLSVAGWMSVDLHADGAGFFAAVVGHARDRMGNRSETVWANDEGVCVSLLSGVLQLAQHAGDGAAASGTALLRATIHPVSSEQPVTLGYSRGMVPDTYGSGPRTTPLAPVEAAASLDALTVPGPDLVATTAALLNGLGQAFGTPELLMLTESGQMRIRYFGNDRSPGIRTWAEGCGIEVTDEVLP